MSERSIDQILNDLQISTRNHALDTAAQVARLYGAPELACQRILMLKSEVKETTDAQA